MIKSLFWGGAAEQAGDDDRQAPAAGPPGWLFATVNPATEQKFHPFGGESQVNKG
jgi:hypothetical protein